MKKKLIVGIILITMILPMLLNFYKVEAFSGELDPQDYITLPRIINISDGIGTGTISLSSRASGYTISYQKVDVTESTFNSIQNKNEELNNCIEVLKEKKANLETLQAEYETLSNSDTATEEQLTEVQNEYNEAYQDYEEFYNTNIITLKNEFYSLIPNYTSSWTTTTNSSNNVQLNFENYSGVARFILWVKIENGTNTYYDMNGYSSTIEQNETVTISKTSTSVKVDETVQLTATSSTDSTITWTSSNSSVATVSSEGTVKGIKEGTAVITAKGSESSATCTVTVSSKNTSGTADNGNGEWTDFSNAKFELKKDGTSGSIIEISNVTPKTESSYYLFITANSSKPSVTSDNTDERIILKYDSKMFKTNDTSKVAKYVELNQDLYVTILERQSNGSEKIVLYGKKLERYAEPKYSDAFHATFMSDDSTQLVTAFTHAKENNRKIQIKVGKVTDVSILQKIKNQDSSGFADLLSFAKSNNGIYNKTVDADKDDWYAIEYNAGEMKETGKSVIDLTSLQDDAYYFLYVKTDDENGKYISQEAVTLGQMEIVNSDSWTVHFYGSSDFEWADFGNVELDDSSKAPDILPDAGIGKYILIISILAIAVITSYIRVRKLKEIK